MKNKLIVLIALFLVCIVPNFVLAQEVSLSIETENILLDMSDAQTVGVRDMFRLTNQSNQPVVSNKENPLISIPIDEKAQHIQVMLSEKELAFEIINNEIVIDYELEANSTTGISITYFLELDKLFQGITLMRNYPVGQFNILIPNDIGFHIHSQQLSDAGALSMGQRTFNSYVANNLPEKTPIAIVADKGAAEQQQTSPDSRLRQNYDGFHSPGHIRFWEKSPFSSFDPHLMTFIFVALIAFSIGYYFYRWHIDEKKLKEMRKEQEEDVFLRLYKEEAVLKRKMTELQLLKEDGTIDDEEFAKRREIYKKKLVNVKMKIREFVE